MGKVKSAIITAILVAAVIVLGLFATISCDVPGSNGVDRYNSFITSIRMSSELTGDAYALLYPEGVISAADYNFVVDDTDETNADKKEEYEATYVKRGSVYVDKDKIGDDADDGAEGSKEQAFKNSVLNDAKILSSRYSEKGYSSYSVSVEDDYVIKVSVPTGFTYAEYNNDDSSSRTTRLSELSATLSYLTYSGGLSIRNDSTYSSSKSIFSVTADVNSFFKEAKYYAAGGTYAVIITLTDEGFDRLNDVLTSSSDDASTVYIFIGETSLGLTLTMGTALSEKTLGFSTEQAYARDVSIILNSVISGNALENKYNSDGVNSTELIAVTSSFGDNAAMYLGIAVIVALLAAIIASVIKYKKLGLVNALIILIYALAILIAILLIDIELSIAGLLAAVVGLALLMFTNFYVFEAVRKETLAGRTIQAAVKTGYRKTVAAILDMHIVLVIISAMLTIICVGAVSSCAFIFFIASIASYVLYWFTRFIWYVTLSPAKDKFAFCGYVREVDDDE